jgi:leader peptidase (prepilin peptidase)/N-methyltransferase
LPYRQWPEFEPQPIFFELAGVMDAVEALLSNDALFIASVALLGLVVGSFLNVVIYRLPLMMEKSWRSECEEFLGLKNSGEEHETAFNLVVPRSRCPHCRHLIAAHENIPVLSYVLLGGKCSECKSPISPRYPLVEVLTALVSVAVAWKLGPNWQTAWALLLSWSLICLSAIDIDHRLLPDSITLPFLWVGLFTSLFGVFTDSHSSIVGAIAGYLSFWLVFQIFKLVTGKEGMGYGDFKLLAMFGAWLGWQSLPLIVLLSSLLGTLVSVATILLFKRDRSLPIPFGPFLGLAGWIALLWGHDITAAYLAVSGTL